LILPPATVRIFSVGSIKGWGAHIEIVLLQGLWVQEEQGLFIIFLEMGGVWLCCMPSSSASFMVSIDSASVWAYIIFQEGSLSWSLMEEIASLFFGVEAQVVFKV